MFREINTSNDKRKLIDDYLATRKNLQQRFINEKLGEDVLHYEASKLFKPITEAQEASSKVTSKKLDKVVGTLDRLPVQLAIEGSPYVERALPEPPAKKRKIVDPDKGLDLTLLARRGFKPPSQVRLSESEEIQEQVSNYNRTLGQAKRRAKNDQERDAIDQEIEGLRKYRNQLRFVAKGQELIVEGEGLKYYSDPNVLVQRLQLLAASKHAGNTGVGNEMSTIIDELHRNGCITKAEAIQLGKNLLH
jgi:hypothetical protein